MWSRKSIFIFLTSGYSISYSNFPWKERKQKRAIKFQFSPDLRSPSMYLGEITTSLANRISKLFIFN